MWTLLYQQLDDKDVKITPIKATSLAEKPEQWINHNMTEQKYLYNHLADEEATKQGTKVKRVEAEQLQDQLTHEEAYLIAIRVAAVGARCWATRGETNINDDDGPKIKDARMKAINKKYDEANSAVQYKHST